MGHSSPQLEDREDREDLLGQVEGTYPAELGDRIPGYVKAPQQGGLASEGARRVASWADSLDFAHRFRDGDGEGNIRLHSAYYLGVAAGGPSHGRLPCFDSMRSRAPV